MKLPNTEEYIARGIKMKRLVHSGAYGLFFSQDPVYEHKTVYDLEEALQMNASNGWEFERFDVVFASLALSLWRDLKDKGE